MSETERDLRGSEKYLPILTRKNRITQLSKTKRINAKLRYKRIVYNGIINILKHSKMILKKKIIECSNVYTNICNAK